MGGIGTGGIIVLAALSDYFYRLGTARTAPKAFAAKKQAIDAAQMKYRQRRDDGMAWLLAQQPEAIGLRS